MEKIKLYNTHNIQPTEYFFPQSQNDDLRTADSFISEYSDKAFELNAII